MKSSCSAIIFFALFLISVALAAPVTDNTAVPLPKASISITNSTVAPPSSTSNPAPAHTLADAMSGTTATASISIIGQPAQVSGAGSTVYNIAAILPIAIVSAVFLF